MRRVLSAVGLMCVALGLAGCGGAQGAPASAAAETTLTAASTTTIAESSTDATAASEVATSVPLGQAAQVGDWKITVVSVDLDANPDLEGFPVSDPLAAGNRYVLLKMKATYTGQSSDMLGKATLFAFRGSKGEYTDSGQLHDPENIQLQTASTGESIAGRLVYAVPAGEVEAGTLLVASPSGVVFLFAIK